MEEESDKNEKEMESGGLRGGGEEELDECLEKEEEEEIESEKHEPDGIRGKKLDYPLHCRSIRIGSYIIYPYNNLHHLPVNLSTGSISFRVPILYDSNKMVSINLKSQDITRVLVYFGRIMPTMFIFTTPSFAEAVRNALRMKLEHECYFDPTSTDEKIQKITFLIDTMSAEQRNFIRHCFLGEEKVKEIDWKGVNEILVKSTPNQVAAQKIIPPQPVMNKTKDLKHLGLKPHLSKNERLPRSYKEVAKVLKDVKACNGILKTVLNNSRLRGPVFKKVYALAANVLKNRHILDKIIQETELLKKETFLREDLAEILIYELVFGKGLPGGSRPVTVVKQYEDSIRKAYEVAVKEHNLKVRGEEEPSHVQVPFHPVLVEVQPSQNFAEDSDGSKSEHSNISEVLQDENQEFDDPKFPGVTDINGQVEMEEEPNKDKEEMEYEGLRGEELDKSLEEEDKEETASDEPEPDGICPLIIDSDYPLHCRSIRIGSYKILPYNNLLYVPVNLSTEAISFRVPILYSNKTALISLRSQDITRVLVHLGRYRPMLFVFTTPSFADTVRNALRMHLGHECYFDPTSTNEKIQKISFLIDSLTADQRNCILTFFPGDKVKEIAWEEANEMLLKSTPNQVAAQKTIPPQPVINMTKNLKHLGLKPHLSKKELLPRSYIEVAKVLKDVKACNGNLKTVLNNSRLRGPIFKKVYALAANVLENRHILDRIIQKTELLKKETFLSEDLAGILIYELVLGEGLPGESRPVTVVKQYEDSIFKAFEVAVKEYSLNFSETKMRSQQKSLEDPEVSPEVSDPQRCEYPDQEDDRGESGFGDFQKRPDSPPMLPPMRPTHLIQNEEFQDNLSLKGIQFLPRYVRVNTLLTPMPDVLENLRKAGYRETYYGENTSKKEYLDLVKNLKEGNFLIDYHFKDLLVFASTENFTTWPIYQKHVQDKSSYIPVNALDPKPGSVVIDACPAPGMKTIYIAAEMENNGQNKLSKKRKRKEALGTEEIENRGSDFGGNSNSPDDNYFINKRKKKKKKHKKEVPDRDVDGVHKKNDTVEQTRLKNEFDGDESEIKTKRHKHKKKHSKEKAEVCDIVEYIVGNCLPKSVMTPEVKGTISRKKHKKKHKKKDLEVADLTPEMSVDLITVNKNSLCHNEEASISTSVVHHKKKHNFSENREVLESYEEKLNNIGQNIKENCLKRKH